MANTKRLFSFCRYNSSTGMYELITWYKTALGEKVASKEQYTPTPEQWTSIAADPYKETYIYA